MKICSTLIRIWKSCFQISAITVWQKEAKLKLTVIDLLLIWGWRLHHDCLLKSLSADTYLLSEAVLQNGGRLADI